MKRYFEATKGSVRAQFSILTEIAFTEVWGQVSHFLLTRLPPLPQ